MQFRLPAFFHRLWLYLPKTQWLIVAVFAIVIALEYSTPPPYVFGYLYIGAVLLANSRLSRKATAQVVLFAVILTVLNLVIPGKESISPATIANRFIAISALIVTGWLSQRNRSYEEAIARQRMQLFTQKQLIQLREDFASTLTHDLKTPLLGAIETLTAFEQEKFGPVTSTQTKVIEIIKRSHKNTLELVETLLDVYRNDTEGLQLKRKSLDLVILAEEAISTLTDLASSRKVYIRLTQENSDFRSRCWVNADPLQLRRVLVNLISNGINHSRRGSTVQVMLMADNGDFVVKVIDEGQGIRDEEFPMLFERFYQGNGDRQAKGSGLGLYLSRQIVEAHGGKIWAEQRSPHGAIFAFRLTAEISSVMASR
jgi:two-component system NarL family sensor kinase